MTIPIKVVRTGGNTSGLAEYADGDAVPVANGGTGATTPSDARTNLGAQETLVSGTNIKTINSAIILGSGNISVGDVTLAGTQTLSNKTVSDVIIDGSYTEEVFAVTGTTPALSPSNGTIQTWSLTGASTPTSGTWNNGQSITLMIDDGTANSINWTSLAVTWKTNGGTAPTLQTTGFTVLVLWKVGNVIYGARVGDV